MTDRTYTASLPLRKGRLLLTGFTLAFSLVSLMSYAEDALHDLSLPTTLSHITPSALSPSNQVRYASCLNGDNHACYELANNLHGGIGAPRADDMAMSLISYTCHNGHALACLELGTRLYLGDGINQDLNSARDNFETACNHGLERGCYMVGHLYLEGEGVLRDLETAATYFSLACQLGMPQACNSLPNLE